MPHNYNYDEPERLISLSRLNSYKTSLETENNAQLFGSYSWNLALVGAFYPLLQVIEVAVRNSINLAAKERINCGAGQTWLECIPSTLDPTTGKVADQVKKFKDNISNARRSAVRALLEKGHVSPVPTLDQIISNTDFSTWEYILDKHFYNGNANSNFLWPTGLPKAFKKLPRSTDSNPMFHQRDTIRRRIEEVRSFRNRISHNEPTWRIDSMQTREDVIASLTRTLDNLIELLFWISPKFKKYIQDVGIEAKIRMLLNTSELNRYMHIFERHEITELEALIHLTQKSNNENIRYYFRSGSTTGILTPHNTLLLQ